MAEESDAGIVPHHCGRNPPGGESWAVCHGNQTKPWQTREYKSSIKKDKQIK